MDRAPRTEKFGEEIKRPAQDAEFVLYHPGNVRATGFAEHLKLTDYADFQAERGRVRQLRREREECSMPDNQETEQMQAAE